MHRQRIINRSGRIRMCRLDVYIKPFAASVGAHANACRALRATVGNRRCTCQCISRAHSHHRQARVHMPTHTARSSRHRQSQVHMSMHAAHSGPLSAKRRCTYQRIPCAHSHHRQARVHMPTHAAPQNRYRQSQVHISMHTVRSEPPATSAGAHINACARSSRQWKRRRNIS